MNIFENNKTKQNLRKAYQNGRDRRSFVSGIYKLAVILIRYTEKDKDSMNDTKLFYKWILPIATIFFGYATLGSFIDSKLDTNNLVKVTGEVSKFYYTRSYTQFSSHTQLNLKLYDGNVYKVSSEWNAKFPTIIKELDKSSKVELYHRKPFQRIYRLGTSNITYQLKIGERTIIDIKERQSKSRSLLYLTGFISILGFSTILVRRKLKTTATNN